MTTNILEEGLRLTLEKRVEPEDLASTLETSRVPVLSTSSLILIIEKAVGNLISPYLKEDEETVSTAINIKHFKPVGLGHKVRCIVHLKFIENKKLFFDIAIFNENHEELAIGAHSRYIVDKSYFESLIK
jgi:fluoroacetyl-CoA thioesterase